MQERDAGPEQEAGTGRGAVETVRSLVKLVAVGLLLGALVRELRMPREERTWHGRLVGVPYDLRPPTLDRVREAWWNPEDDRVLVPRPFGVGWAPNLAAIRDRLTA